MASLLDVEQIRWPKLPCAGGYSLRVVINLPGYTGIVRSAAATLIFTDEPKIISDIDLSKRRQGSGGQSAYDSVMLQLRDSVKYSGTINSVPITEDFSYAGGNTHGKQFSTVLSQLFRIKGTKYKPNPYRVWILWYNPSGTLIDSLAFTYDALQKLQPKQEIQNPETDHEQIIHAVRSVQLVSIQKLSSSTLWRDARKYITKSMCEQGDFYNGYCFGPSPGYYGQNGDDNGVLLPNDGIPSAIFGPHGRIMQAVPYIDVQPEQNTSVTRSCNTYGADFRDASYSGCVFPSLDPNKPWPEQRGLTNWQIHPLIDSIIFIQNAGTGYSIGDTFEIIYNGLNSGFHFGTARNATAIVDTVGGSGNVLTFHLTDGGEGYPSTLYLLPDMSTTTSGGGHGLTFSFRSGSGTIQRVPESYGPWGTWGIPVWRLFDVCCSAMGFSSFDDFEVRESPLKVHYQIRFTSGSAGAFLVRTDSGGHVDQVDQTVCLNAYIGAHPLDGSYWPNPVMFNPDGACEDVLQVLCDTLQVDRSVVIDLTTGLPKLHLTPFGSSGTRPSRWIPSTKPTEESPSIGVNGVSVHYRGDGIGIVCPLLPPSQQTRGTNMVKEVLWRLRRIGRTYLMGFSSIFEDTDLSWDDDTLLELEASNHFRIATCPQGDQFNDVQVNNGCWLPLTGLYFYTKTPAIMYQLYNSSCWNDGFDNGNPTNSNVTSSPNGDGYGSGTYAKGAFYPLGVEYRVADTPNASESDGHRFDSRHHQAVGMATFLVPQTTNLKRAYTNAKSGGFIGNGAIADDGTISGVKVDMTTTFLYDDAMRTFRFTEIIQRLRAGVIPMVRMEEVLSNVFPDIDDLPHGKAGSSPGGGGGGSMSSGTGGGGGTTGGAGGGANTSASHWEPDRNVTLTGAGLLTLTWLDTYYRFTDNTTTGITKPVVAAINKTLILENATANEFLAGDFLMGAGETWFLIYNGTEWKDI